MLGVSAVCFLLRDVLGYHVVALVLLLVVSVLAMVVSLRPVLIAALLSALIWDFFFIPPHYTFTVSSSEDALMLVMYFVVALLNGVFTSRLRRIERLVQEKEARAAALKLYDTLFDALAHELRTPITGIMGATDHLLVRGEQMAFSERKNLYRQIGESTDRLHRTVNDLLSLSRLEAGTVKLRLEWCDLNELIYTVLEKLKTELSGKKVDIHLSQDMPLFQMDFGLMEQALFNIVHNAAKYTHEGQTIRINTRMAHDGGWLDIEDEGPGFDKEDLPHIFERFFQGKNSKKGGVGLGLSISKELIAAHHGDVRVENLPSGGARFSIFIPKSTRSVATEWPDIYAN